MNRAICSSTLLRDWLRRTSSIDDTMSAMRDPELYADPETFDMRRTDHPRLHLIFGQGPHRCIGEMLARPEMEESLEALLADAPGIEIETAPRMVGFGGIRQVTPMIVRIP